MADVTGIRYEEFAALKWPQFIGWMAALMAVILFTEIAAAMRDGGNLSVVGIVVVVLVAAVLVLFQRRSFRSEYRKSGLAEIHLKYEFKREGWTVRQGEECVYITWDKTRKVKTNKNALLLYLNKKSANLVPLRDLSDDQVKKILDWAHAKNK